MKKLLFTTALLMVTFASAASAGPEANNRGHWVAPGQWQMNDVGRNHSIITEPGIAKCNPHVSPECARLYPCLLKGWEYCKSLAAARKR